MNHPGFCYAKGFEGNVKILLLVGIEQRRMQTLSEYNVVYMAA